MRPDGRRADQLRQVVITPDYNRYAEGSVLIECGETKVLCTASVENKVPPFLEGKGVGWVTSEYGMLPRSTHTRCGRNTGGRGQEIQRLIGRALRAAIDTKKLGPRQITIDCDVIQADGGTRTASITGGWVALAIALKRLGQKDNVPAAALRRGIAAISTGIVKGEPRLDLAYEEDSAADVDCNFDATDDGRLIEVQGTAEAEPFSPEEYGKLLALAQKGCAELFKLQKEAVAKAKGGTGK